MRTTLDIDDDEFAIARARAARERSSIGQVLSALARTALQPGSRAAATARNGVPLLSGKGRHRPVTLELVNQLRDQSP